MRAGGRAGALDRALAVVLAIVTAAGMLALLHGAWSAFTNFKFTLTDYGKYTNMLWNSGHGRLFRVLTDHSYLQTHLSFTLAPLGALFWAWDHPFLLAAIQWLLVAAGAGVLAGTARRAGWGPGGAAALALFTLLHPYTQAVLLSEFHGVALYYLLVSWLLHALLFRRGLVWLPLVLLLGVREDAAFAIVPLLLYVAVTERWRAGYWWSLVALLYGASATTWLFRVIGGLSITARRDRLGPGAILGSLVRDPWTPRLAALFWLFLPTVAFLRRGWRPILAVPSAAVATVALSPFAAQHTMAGHYPAASMSLLAAGLVLAGRPASAGGRPLLAAGTLAGLTLVAHGALGFAPGGGRSAPVYREPRPLGVAALRAARALPPDGLLVADDELAVFAANRAALVPWRLLDPARHRPALYLFTIEELDRPPEGPVLSRMLAQNSAGVVHFDGWFAIARVGATPAGNRAVLRAHDARSRTILFAFTRRQAGTEALSEEGVLSRHWAGDPRQTPVISTGGSVRLDPGAHRALLRYRTDRPPDGRGTAGMLRLFQEGDLRPLVEVSLPPGAGDGFRELDLAFDLPRASRVEARVAGGARAVWLDRLVFDPTP